MCDRFLHQILVHLIIRKIHAAKWGIRKNNIIECSLLSRKSRKTNFYIYMLWHLGMLSKVRQRLNQVKARTSIYLWQHFFFKLKRAITEIYYILILIVAS